MTEFILPVEYDEASAYAEENSLLFMETSAKTAVRIVHTSWLSINAKSPSSSDAQYLLVNNSSCCPHVLCYISKLNVNDIFLAIAKKLPKDGEGGAAGAGGIR